MDKLANSEDLTGIGEVITLDRTVAFVKRSPEAVTKEMLSKHSSVCKEEYEQWFHTKDFNLSLSLSLNEIISFANHNFQMRLLLH